MRKETILGVVGNAARIIVIGLALVVLIGVAEWKELFNLFRLGALNLPVGLILLISAVFGAYDLRTVFFYQECHSVVNLIRGRGEVLISTDIEAVYSDEPPDLNKLCGQFLDRAVQIRNDFIEMVPNATLEEIMLRGSLLVVWNHCGLKWGVLFLVVQAVFFGLSHFDSAMTSGDIRRFVFYAPVHALLWGLLTIASGSILFSIFLHLLNNALGMTSEWLLCVLAERRLRKTAVR